MSVLYCFLNSEVSLQTQTLSFSNMFQALSFTPIFVDNEGPERAEEDVEKFITQALRGAGLQAARHVSQPKRQRKLCSVSSELQGPVHPAD